MYLSNIGEDHALFSCPDVILTCSLKIWEHWIGENEPAPASAPCTMDDGMWTENKNFCCIPIP
jgi:hypothetical protein